MKKLVITSLVIMLLAVLTPCLATLAQPAHIPHQNPATARGSPNMVSILHFYGNVYDLIATSDYQEAQSMLGELEHASIPDELRDSVNSYSSLSEQLTTTLNNLAALLNEASTLFAHHQTNDARQRLNEAEPSVRSARFLLADVEAVTSTLGDELGVLPAAAGGKVNQAYEHLQQNIDRTRQLINELDQLRESLGLNPLMAVKTEFYHPTLLEVSAPETAYPGLPITINGQVSSTDGAASRLLRVLIDNTRLAETMVPGRFSLKITPPRQIATGDHSLTVVVTPQEYYAGAATSLPITISRMPIQTKIQVPQFTVIPKIIQISGQVYHGLTPVTDARVSLAFRDATTVVKTVTDGSFTGTIEAPLNLSLIGPQELGITIEPVEPWYASLETERGILAINPVITGLMLAALAALGLLAFTRTRLPSPHGATITPEAEFKEPPIIAPAPGAGYPLTGTTGRILSAYGSGLRAVEKATGIPMAPHTTLREFLNTTSPKLPTAIEPFTELTALAETALYSALELDEHTATSAELLAATIRKELHRGAT